MTEKSITVTEAARNFADCVNRAHYQSTTFILHKNGIPVARLVPIEQKKPSTGREIAAALANVHLPAQEADAWLSDLEEARSKITPPVNRWES
ncbi:MAG: hypothetical protein ABR956_07395 [Terracidiphilus sp.]|jgi:antitoxin (DNA-binding transcriptional repressor) of toxin-antitoxin stability system